MKILQGDWIEQLRTLPDESVQCCVTSPPYWGLRDYGTATWEGGDPNCDHIERSKADAHHKSTLGPKRDGLTIDNAAFKARERTFADVCGKCGAKRIDRQLGLEKTPEEYVAKMVKGFHEVRRVLRNDGTLWLNLGDSYAASGKGGGGNSIQNNAMGREISEKNGFRMPPSGYKQKDLVGIPWMVAFALRADGWYLRSDIIWAKANCMPESVTDRPTRSHEYIFLLTKSRRYYYDADAIKEPPKQSSIARLGQDVASQNGSNRANGGQKTNGPMKAVFGGRNKASGYGGRLYSGREDDGKYIEAGVNKRDVWTIAPANFPEAHFATYPPDLIKPCILAGSKPGDTILDPFGGSGTTGMVAIELGRHPILIELNPAYIDLIHQRCHVTPGLPI